MTIDTCQIHQYTELTEDGECPTCKALGSSPCSADFDSRCAEAVIQFAGDIQHKPHHPAKLRRLIHLAQEPMPETGGELVRDGWRVLRIGDVVQDGDMQVNGGLIEKACPVDEKWIEWRVIPVPAPTFLRQNAQGMRREPDSPPPTQS